ncbi:hypothetical protein ABZ714_11285 [Streptomyces sp. NPDC006798]|uniref:hypothetical protein n=1 Tax=Streptomyces sp. NPDC006798 TaxID=3155462 RepID=UPI0034092A73
MPSSSLPAQISLSVSARSGIVATVGGEKYSWAETALKLAGFTRDHKGVYTLPDSDPAATRLALAQLVVIAGRHRSAVTTSSRPYIGDVADSIARHLPGTWTWTVEIYSHPIWQEDLVPWLWDSGPLASAVRTERVPYAVQFDNGDGVHLLLAERPGHADGYLLGALAPEPFDDNDTEPNAPLGIVLPQAPDAAARAITDQFLPGYHQAVQRRRIDAVDHALARTRALVRDQRPGIPAAGRDSGGHLVPDGAVAAWYEFREFLVHGPFLFAHVPPEQGPSAERAALERLRGALEAGSELLRDDWDAAYTDPAPAAALIRTEQESEAQRSRLAWPLIRTWLADGDTLIRQARARLDRPGARSPALAPFIPRALPPGASAGHHR